MNKFKSIVQGGGVKVAAVSFIFWSILLTPIKTFFAHLIIFVGPILFLLPLAGLGISFEEWREKKPERIAGFIGLVLNLLVLVYGFYIIKLGRT